MKYVNKIFDQYLNSFLGIILLDADKLFRRDNLKKHKGKKGTFQIF